MRIDEIKKAMINDGNDIYFIRNGRESGISSEVMNSVFTFHAWYGVDSKDFKNFDEMLRDKFFGGQALVDFINEADVYFC